MMSHPYAAFLKDVERPGRYIGGEYGAARPLEEADLRLVLSYPDTYEIGMSHIGLRVLYETVNRMPGISCERVFMPWSDLERALRDRDLPLVSLESARPLAAFDLVGFSLQYELVYTNLLAMLDLGRIPRRADHRSEAHPIILVGGPLAAHAEPLTPFIDLALIGDGEEALPQLLEAMRAYRKAGLDRSEIISRLCDLVFVLAPNALSRSADPVSKRVVVDRCDQPAAEWAKVSHLGAHATGAGPVPTVEAVFDRFSLEVARGCTGGCRFCQAGYLYRPVRERCFEETRDAIADAVTCMGFDGISLSSLSTADYSALRPILTGLGDAYTARRVSFFVPSLRAYGLDDDLVEVVSRLRATGVTLAPEAGNERLRDIINKNVTDEELLAAAARFFDWGAMRIKLYFMLGLPEESDEDLLDIIRLSEKLRDFGRTRLSGRTPSVTVSVSTFVPKPFTPFEREGMISAEEIVRRQRILMTAGRERRLEVRTHHSSLSVLEALFCRGDITLAPILEAAVDAGARFDGWGERYRADIWERVLDGVDIPAMLAPIEESGRLPWDHIAAGVSPAFIAKERERAKRAKPTVPCGRYAGETGGTERFICHHCGLACEAGALPLKPCPQPRDLKALPPPKRQRGRPVPRNVGLGNDGQPVRMRLYLAKWARQAFVGHLDTMRHVMLSLRRAGLVLQYTSGFNPKPKIATAPPLPLGVCGLREPMELSFIDPPSPDEMLDRLSRAMPEDMAFVGADIVPQTEKGLGKHISAACYVALVPIDQDRAARDVVQMLASPVILVPRDRKGMAVELDIRPYIQSAKIVAAQPAKWRLPCDEGRAAFAFTLKIPGTGGARVSEVLLAAFGPISGDPWVVRTEVLLA